MVSILVSFKSISNISPFTAYFPFSAILSLSMGREAYEDYNRHKSDAEMNKTKSVVFK